ncbi:hypothetical protein LXL04_022561 [Taraxacum kok-saghyz]
MAEILGRYRYEYGGTCTTAMSDGPDLVIDRAYDVFINNCEDFALYCKTGILASHGTSGQVASVLGSPLAALLTFPLKYVLPTPMVVTATTGMHCITRYENDVGVRSDVVKVNLEDLGDKVYNHVTTCVKNNNESSIVFAKHTYTIFPLRSIHESKRDDAVEEKEKEEEEEEMCLVGRNCFKWTMYYYLEQDQEAERVSLGFSIFLSSSREIMARLEGFSIISFATRYPEIDHV